MKKSTPTADADLGMPMQGQLWSTEQKRMCIFKMAHSCASWELRELKASVLYIGMMAGL